MATSLTWPLSVPMTHAARTLHSIFMEMASPSGEFEADDITICFLVGQANGDRAPISDKSLYRLRNELVNLGLVGFENVYDTSPGMGAPKVLTRRYRLAMAPQEVSR